MMRNIENIAPSLMYFVLLSIFFFSSCTLNSNPSCKADEISEWLNISKPTKISNYISYSNCLDNAYFKPCVFLCKFSTKEDDFINWMQVNSIPLVDSIFQTDYCLNSVEWYRKITSLDMRDFVHLEKVSWWNLDKYKPNIQYAAFYNREKKTIHSIKSDNIEGRFLAIFNKETGDCYLIIESFL